MCIIDRSPRWRRPSIVVGVLLLAACAGPQDPTGGTVDPIDRPVDAIVVDLFGTVEGTTGFEWSRYSDDRLFEQTTIERSVAATILVEEGRQVTSTSHLTFVSQHDGEVYGVSLRPLLRPRDLDEAVASLDATLDENGLMTDEVRRKLAEGAQEAADASDEWPQVPQARFRAPVDGAELFVWLRSAESGGWFYTVDLVRPDDAGPDAPHLPGEAAD